MLRTLRALSGFGRGKGPSPNVDSVVYYLRRVSQMEALGVDEDVDPGFLSLVLAPVWPRTLILRTTRSARMV